MAIKPLVLVFQELRQPSVNIINPTLSGCVIGPHYHLKTYDEHKDELFAVKYDVLSGNSGVNMPAAVPGMVLKAEDFKVYLDDARARISKGTSGSIDESGLLIGDTGEDFTSEGDVVKVGDTVKLTHILAMTGAASGDGDGANPERITITDIDDENVVEGDLVDVDSGTYTGTVSAVGAGYVEVTPAIGTGVNFSAADVEITRERVVRDVSTGQTYAVKEVDSSAKNKLQLTSDFPFAASNVAYEVTRKVDKAELTDSYYSLDLNAKTVDLTPAGKVTVDELDREIENYSGLLSATDADIDKALVYIEYKALDVSYAHIPAKITKAADISAQMGITDGRNPLGLGATVMFGNSQAVMYAIGLESEDLAGWTKAVDAINRGGYYAQALLTQDASITAVFKSNNVANEAPEKAKYGLCIGNHSLPDLAEPAGSDAGATLTDPATSTIIVFQDATADFTDTANPVLPGDTLTVGGTTHIIDSVINSNRVKVMPADAFVSEDSGLTYTITRELTKDQQAATLAATSSALGNKRAIMTYSDLCVIEGEEEPGYYLNCVVAGMISGLPSQAGITNKGAAVIEKVKNTNWDYFTDDQLDVIATGGTLIFVQDEPDSLPYIRHQLTTDTSLIETSEISVVKNNDYLSLFFKGIVKPYLGEWNVTQDLLDALRTAVSQGIEFQKSNKVAKIGAPLIDATIQTLEISSISPDRVEIYLDTTQPKPLNTIGLHMIL